MASAFATDGDGRIWMSWMEVSEARETFRCARFDSQSGRFGPALTVASGNDFIANWADIPVFAADGENLIGVWSVENPHGHGHHAYYAMYSTSKDGGKTWSKPASLTNESKTVEFVALEPLGRGRFLAAWLDGRKKNEKRQTLYSRVIGERGPDVLIDGLVCDCCQLSTTKRGDSIRLAYRGRTEDEVRDMKVVDFVNGKWTEPTPLHEDGWKIAACPVNGPQLASSGMQSGAVWFTAPEEQPRVHAAFLTDTGAARRVATVNLGRSLGRVDAVMLDDGSMAMTWVEVATQDRQGGIFLRVMKPDGTLSDATLIAPSSSARASGFPRIASISGRSALLLTCTKDGDPSEVLVFEVAI